MSLLSPAADFVYGNTRLRARKADLLAAEDYEALAGRDLDGLFEALAATDYRREVEAALAGSSDLRALHEALGRHLARALGEMRAFYDGAARELVDLLLARFDLHNLLALLRGRAGDFPPEDVLVTVIPLGSLGDAAAREVAGQLEVAAAVDLLVAWRLPDPPTARALADAWPAFERTQDLAALEHALVVRHALRVEEALRVAGPEAEPLRELVARERDAANVLQALRLRATGERVEQPGDSVPARFLAGGRIAAAFLEAALQRPAAAEAAADLAAAARREDWRAPLARFAAGGDLAALQGELERSRVHFALGLFLRGDPLGVDVPVAYAVAKENELRNLRLIVEGAAAGLPAAALRGQLLVPGEETRWAA